MIRRTLLSLTLASTAWLPAVGSRWMSQDDGPVGSGPTGGQDRGGESGGGEQSGDQEGEADEGLERDIFGRLGRPARTEQGTGKHPLLGAWQLIDLDAEGYPEDGMFATGYLLVTEGFLAFEMHALWDPEDGVSSNEDGFQTFFAEYTLVAGSVLSCKTLIGSYLDEDSEELFWEDAGVPREFTSKIENELLTLTWEDGEMVFGRRRPSGTARTGVFGEIEALPSIRRGADAFGRESAGQRREERAVGEEDGR